MILNTRIFWEFESGTHSRTHELTNGILPMKKYKGFWIFIWLKPYTPYAKATEVTAINKCHTGVLECKRAREWDEIIFCMSGAVIFKDNV